jgi:ABC-type phosphate transport system substrate-binding protein
MMRRVASVVIVLTVAILLRALSAHGGAGPLPPAPAAAAGSEQSLAIIVNQSNPVENFSLPELRKIFLGERSHWPNGRRITLVMMDPTQPERKVILREIYGMNEKDLNSHFIQGVFTGVVFVSPKTLATPSEVLKFVFNVPGAIGYVRAADADSSVKILRVDGRLPDDKDYKLRMQSRAGKP